MGIPKRDRIKTELAKCECCETCWNLNQKLVKAKHLIAMGVLRTMETCIHGYCHEHAYIIKKAYENRNLKLKLSDKDYVDEILMRTRP